MYQLKALFLPLCLWVLVALSAYCGDAAPLCGLPTNVDYSGDEIYNTLSNLFLDSFICDRTLNTLGEGFSNGDTTCSPVDVVSSCPAADALSALQDDSCSFYRFDTPSLYGLDFLLRDQNTCDRINILSAFAAYDYENLTDTLDELYSCIETVPGCNDTFVNTLVNCRASSCNEFTDVVTSLTALSTNLTDECTSLDLTCTPPANDGRFDRMKEDISGTLVVFGDCIAPSINVSFQLDEETTTEECLSSLTACVNAYDSSWCDEKDAAKASFDSLLETFTSESQVCDVRDAAIDIWYGPVFVEFLTAFRNVFLCARETASACLTGSFGLDSINFANAIIVDGCESEVAHSSADRFFQDIGYGSSCDAYVCAPTPAPTLQPTAGSTTSTSAVSEPFATSVYMLTLTTFTAMYFYMM